MMGQNGTSDTPICDLIERLLSHDLSRGTLEAALLAARPIEAVMSVKTQLKPGYNREKERLRKAAYRANLSHGTSRDTATSLSIGKTVNSNKTDSPKKVVPRDKAGQPSDWPTDFREQFWRSFPRKTEKKAAVSKLEAIHKSGTVPWERFIAGVIRYARHVRGTEERYIKHPTTWLNRGCWDDEFNTKGGLFGEANRGSNSRDGLSVVNARLRRSANERAAHETAQGGSAADQESGYGYRDAEPFVVGVAGVR